MLERIFALIIFLMLSYVFIKKLNSTKKISNTFLPFEIKNLNPGLPTILYFWTEQCTQCNNAQKPAIVKLKDEGNEFNFISLNATKELEKVKNLNIKTVPSTVILNAEKKIQYINSGYTAAAVLKKQLNAEFKRNS